MNLTVVLALSGVAVAGVGLAVANAKAGREKGVGSLAPGARGVVAPNVPTHTTNPQAEQQAASLGQLLASYQSDLRQLEAKELSLRNEMRELEQAAGRSCENYAQNPVWGCDSEGFMGQSNRCYIKSEAQDAQAYSACRNYATGAAEYLEAARKLPFQNSFNLSGSWRDAQAEVQHSQMLKEIAEAYRQVRDIREKYLRKKQEIQSAQEQIAQVRKLISDLNARGVY
jgi:DNA repair exonuclease SbcCD ATPase subunit